MLTVLLYAAAVFGMQEPIRVTASLSADRINVGGTTTLQVTVETRGAAPEEIRLPQLSRELEILGTSDFTQTQISVPGGRSRATRRDVVIAARSPGVYRIPPVVVRVGGAEFRTAPLDLIVRTAASPDVRSAARSSLRIAVDPDTVYVGEQVLLRAEATFVEETRSRQSRPPTFDPPAPTGFWIQDLSDPIRMSLRVEEGRTVERQTYRRAYFPLAPGTYYFPPARLHYEVRRGFLYPAETRELTSDSARLVVLPVPAEGQPATYNGAVGRLSLRASVAPQSLRAGEATVLTVEIEGTGNVRALPEPRLPEMEGLEVFPPSQDSRVDATEDVVSGMKRFRWMLVPEQPGTMVIPSVEYSVFDPELRTYVVLRTDPITVHVAHFATAAGADTALRPLRSRPAGERLAWVGSPLFAVVQVAPLLLLVGAVEVRRRRSLLPGPEQEIAGLRQQLDELRTAADPATTPGELERIVREAVTMVVGVEGEPVETLRRQKRPAAAAELDGLLGELRRRRFAPAEPYDVGQLIDRVDAFITLLQPRRGGRTRSTLALAFLAFPAAFVASVSAFNTHDDLFRIAVLQYGQGEYAAAANTFHQYALAVPNDPAGWYDLGLAAHRAGDPGTATWAWLRTVRITPRDADVRHNLLATGAAPALRRVQPIDRLSVPERRLAASLGWWLLIGAAAIVVVRPGTRRAAMIPGAALLTLIVFTSAIMAARPAYVTPLGDGAALHAAPTTRDVALGALRAGSVARLVERRDDWLRVRTDAGQDAWVEERAVAAP